MKCTILFTLLSLFPAAGQETKIAVVGLVHSHVWGHLGRMIQGGPAHLVGIAETRADLIEEAKRRGAPAPIFFDDYRKMLDQTRPDIVWAFVENNRHLEIVQACAPRKIHVMFEKPLASTYKDALAIRELARRHGIQVMTNYQMAWWPSQYAAKAQADSGALGQVWRIRGIVGHGGPGGPTGLNRYFFEWLTDPVKNGAGALVDFGCYNALWALWYLGRPESVYAQANHLRPETFPKVEDHSTLVLHYPKAVAILEGSWDLPRSFQDLEVFGREGSLYVTQNRVEWRKGRGTPEEISLPALPPERAEPVAYMIHCLRTGQPLEGLVSLDINVQVCEILEAAKMSLRNGQAVKLPLKAGT
jgi:predicted dehydrogenase